MTQEEKQLLLKDLCARLPYLVKGLYQWKGNVPFDRELDGRLYDELYLSLYSTKDSSFKPYLRPMSSMTEEEKKEMSDGSSLAFEPALNGISGYCPETMAYNTFNVDFCLAHHLDYRGLIEKGLAIEAPDGMYKED